MHGDKSREITAIPELLQALDIQGARSPLFAGGAGGWRYDGAMPANPCACADHPFADVQVLAFDVFGTVVDWHGSIVREMQALYPAVDGNAFGLAWRARYQPALARVRAGAQGWAVLDELHRAMLEEILPRFGLAHLSEAERRQLSRVWQRLDARPDSVAGLARLKTRFIITTLSNGNIGLLTRMAKRAGLPWDCVLSAESFQAYKPSPAVYRGLARGRGAMGCTPVACWIWRGSWAADHSMAESSVRFAGAACRALGLPCVGTVC